MAEDGDLKKRSEIALRISQESHGRAPRNEWWGMFSYADGPPYAGGGVGSFQWFETRDELLDYVANHMAFGDPPPSDSNVFDIARKVEAIGAAVRSGTTGWEEGREQLNNVLSGISQITWWGSFQDLRTARHPYAAEVVASFREEQAEDGEEDASMPPGPIGDDEMDAFREFISTYGV